MVSKLFITLSGWICAFLTEAVIASMIQLPLANAVSSFHHGGRQDDGDSQIQAEFEAFRINKGHLPS
jgi:hypothetical protein